MIWPLTLWLRPNHNSGCRCKLHFDIACLGNPVPTPIDTRAIGFVVLLVVVIPSTYSRTTTTRRPLQIQLNTYLRYTVGTSIASGNYSGNTLLNLKPRLSRRVHDIIRVHHCGRRMAEFVPQNLLYSVSVKCLPLIAFVLPNPTCMT